MTALLTSVEDSVVLCIDAPWGDGKTTFSRMWRADLNKQGKHCISFDAYEHNHSDDPFVAFCGEIISLVGTDPAGSGAAISVKSFKNKAIAIGGRLLVAGTKIGLKAATLGVIGEADLDSMASVGKDIADGVSEIGSAVAKKALDDYTESKKTLTEFRKRLSDIGEAIKREQDFPLVIIIDELDRCRPDFALSLIERIKHLFSAQYVHFVILANPCLPHCFIKLRQSTIAIHQSSIECRASGQEPWRRVAA